MPKYLYQGSYTQTGAQGLLKEGGTSRKDMVSAMVESMGGRVEAFYFAFGGNDICAIVDVPDHATAAALSIAVGVAGTLNLTTTVLIEPEEIDEAVKKTVNYRPPGQ
jgi:uncharacterized protein with GYD domain